VEISGTNDRYARQVRFAPLGSAGQEKLAAAKVVIVGCGALGTFSASALARAGVGSLRIIDRDLVEWSNLQRQWLFEEEDARDGKLKAVAAVERLKRANSEIRYEALVADLDAANAEELLDGASLVLDATDNFATRYVVNDFCVQAKIPWVYGAAVGAYGLVFPVLPELGPCLRCIYPEAPTGAQPTCETAGVLNTITSLVAAWQSAIATRILTSAREEIPLTLTTFESWEGKVRQLNVARDLQCECCGKRNFEHLDGKRRAPISLCGRDAVQIHERRGRLDLAKLEAELAGLGESRRNEFALRFEPTGLDLEMTIFPDGRAIIKGTTDSALARTVYARYLGR
jgi:adenylyltransferase/sulfurtransferase